MSRGSSSRTSAPALGPRRVRFGPASSRGSPATALTARRIPPSRRARVNGACRGAKRRGRRRGSSPRLDRSPHTCDRDATSSRPPQLAKSGPNGFRAGPKSRGLQPHQGAGPAGEIPLRAR
jgi:hypothetical protein